MSSNRPAFANSLVAMYGSGSETSEDEDPDTEPPAVIIPSTGKDTSEEPVESPQGVAISSEGSPTEDVSPTVASDPIIDAPLEDLPQVLPAVGVNEQSSSEVEKMEEDEPVCQDSCDSKLELPSEEKVPSPALNNAEPLSLHVEDVLDDQRKDEDDLDPDKGSQPPCNIEDSFQLKETTSVVSQSPDSMTDAESDNVDGNSDKMVEIFPSDPVFEESASDTPSSSCDIVDSAMKVSETNSPQESSEDSNENFTPVEAESASANVLPSSSLCADNAQGEQTKSQTVPEKRKRSPSPDKAFATTTGGRRLRQVRNPSAKAAEAAADAAFVAAVTPTRKNLKEAKKACALAKVSDTPDAAHMSKKMTPNLIARTRKGRSSSQERFSLNIDSRVSPVSFTMKEDSNTSDNSSNGEGKLSSISEEENPDIRAVPEEEIESIQNRNCVAEGEKPIGIKLKISRESVQILDPGMSKLEVQIPNEAVTSEVTASPGGTKRHRKFKEGALSPIAPLSPITLKIAKSKEGLEVVSNENASMHSVSTHDQEVGKVEKITLKISSRDDRATIVKPSVEEISESRPEKLTLKLVKGESSNVFSSSLSQDDVEETKLEKITLKLSKGDSACIVKRKEIDPSASENDSGKLERITLKLSTDNNASIVRPKDVATQLERGASASPELGKVEKITLKVSRNDNVSIVKPLSPTPSTAGIEKLTLKVSKAGTAVVSGKQHDEPSKECEKLEKITLKLSKDNDGVSIVKPASPVLDRKGFKLARDEPLSPLSPLIISRGEDLEPQKERITLKLSKAGGHPSPVGVVDERSSWSIKSNDSDNVPSPVSSDPSTPKARPKRIINEISEAATIPAKRLKLADSDKPDESDLGAMETQNTFEEPQKMEEEEEEEEECEEVPSKPEADMLPVKQSPGEIKTNKIDSTGQLTEDSTDVILLDSEDSQSGITLSVPESAASAPVVNVDNEVTTTGRKYRRKARGRPRRQVLTPGSTMSSTVSTPANPDAEAILKTPPKPKREKVRPEPIESDRPKRSCKGREKPPPKPPAKPRGRAAALAKQKAEQQSVQPEEPQLFEEETRMSADCGGQSEVSVPLLPVAGLVAKVMVPRLSANYISAATGQCETPADSSGQSTINEESQASQGSLSLISSTTESTPNRGNRKGRMEINVDPEAQADFTVDLIAEYMWPPGDGDLFMVQEQISAFLGVKSFKRKYPNLQRRAVDHDERQYLLERRLVSESLCDLGLTALLSHEVLDVLSTDFPEKFEEYRKYIKERAQREYTNKQRAMLAAASSGKEDPKSKAMRNMASFNAMLNRNRKDQRRACFDLQSFTVHYPEDRRRQMSIPNLPRIGAYPLALVPGQYTDFYKRYTAAELRYFPVNTVLYGPLLPHEMMKSHAGGSDGSQTDSSDSSSSDSSSSGSDSSGSDSDSDSDSSSDSDDDSSSQMGPAPLESQEIDLGRPEAVCRVCNGDRLKNKLGLPEGLIHCANCEKSGHLSCLDLTPDMIPHIRKYSWHCTDCKLCAQCNDTADEDKMLFCDMCDRGYHIYCVGLRKVPEGRWHCKECAVCASCGARDPGGTEEHQAAQPQVSQDTPSKAEPPQWQHEFKKGDKGTRLYVRTLCVPCLKLWRKGRYCRLCWKCFTNQPEEEGLINCSICDRWMHADCCRKAGRVIDADKLSSYICELCQQKGVSKSPSKVMR